jgi:SWI/SNF-related matrix-associated actin-dependent regulator of chromatin subfamily A-like protein 1
MGANYRMKTASIVKGKYIRTCLPKGDHIRNHLPDVDTITYDGGGCWKIPLKIRFVERLKGCDFVFSSGLEQWLEEERIKRKERKRLSTVNIPGLGGELYHFQLEGVDFIEKHDGRALIADEMGLGKTVQALAWAQLRGEEVKPILLICPSFLKVNWKRETEKWVRNVDVRILNGQTPYEISGDFVIVNYDVLAYWEKELKEYGFKTLIVDEAHFLKNNRAKRTKAFKRINKTMSHLIALTGTPIEARPIDIYNIVYAIDPTVFPNFITFTMDFCDAYKDTFGWNRSGSSNTLLLNQLLTESVMIRRRKKDVLKELPPKQFVKVPLEIDNVAEYLKVKNRFVEHLKEQFAEMDIDGMEEKDKKKLLNYAKGHDIDTEEGLTEGVLEKIKRKKLKTARKNVIMKFEPLKQLAAQGKMKGVVEWIEDFLESGEKLVVFTYHTKVIETLMTHFPHAVKVDGSVSMKNRQKVVDKFQKDPSIKLFLGQITAAGIGITLTAASNVAVVQYPWNPGPLFQAVDRTHRISQMKQVMVWCLVGEGTIEEHIIDILIRKEKMINEILDGKEHENISILSELINIYKKE